MKNVRNETRQLHFSKTGCYSDYKVSPSRR